MRQAGLSPGVIFGFLIAAAMVIMTTEDRSAVLARTLGGRSAMNPRVPCRSALIMTAVLLLSAGLWPGASTALASDTSAEGFEPGPEQPGNPLAEISDDIKHGVRIAHKPLLPQRPAPAGPQSGDSTEQRPRASYGPLRYQAPVPGEMSFGDCSTHNDQSRPKLDPGLEILRPDERLKNIAALNQPQLDWITNSPVFNISVLMQSLLALLDRLQDLLDERTSGCSGR
jgi:hypothetical protein